MIAFTTFETQLSASAPIVNLISKRYYLIREVTMSARETAELLLLAGRLVQADGYDGELSPAQWMALRYFARANPFSRTRRPSRSFKRPPVAPLRRRSRHLRQVGTWSDSDPRRTGEASVCD